MRTAKVAKTDTGPPQKWIKFLVHVVIPTALGAWIYIAFRSPNLLVFDWIDAVGMSGLIIRPNAQLPDWLLYSLPDGCWVYAFTSWMLIIWARFSPWVLVALTLAIGSELGQLFSIVPGTYDNVDIVFYLFGFIFAGACCAQTHLFDIRRFGYGRLGVR